MRTTAVLFLLSVTACADERLAPVEAPFITCQASDVRRASDGEWIGTGTELIGPPGTFDRNLAGTPVEVALVGFPEDDDPLELVRGGVRDDGGFYVVLQADGMDIRDLPIAVSVGTSTYVVHAAARPMVGFTLDHDPSIVEGPDGWMAFRASTDEPVELGAFLSLSTDEMVELPTEVRRIDARLRGHEGHKARAGFRTAEGEICFATPCGCSDDLRAAGRCGPPPEPTGDPDDVI